MSFPKIVDLNVGGINYTASLDTLRSEEGSLLHEIFSDNCSSPLPKDSQGRYFIDRDGNLFRFILDYLRNDKQLILPENFTESTRLRAEADFYRLSSLQTAIKNAGPGSLRPLSLVPVSLSPLSSYLPTGGAGYICVGYRGTFAFGRDGLADVKFRKIARITVSGKVTLCREVFGETLNESRDPDNRGLDDRYTARFFLKHVMLEQAFDNLQEAGFRCVGSCGSGTNCGGCNNSPLKPGADTEENKWNHYNEYIFVRP
ncbi:BTB/POZ domain-containing protein KCTD12-like protein [Dinothrombium tinctorium]|uniref:BTB/POZ domain-containing protein KCTD12-like protein n=1 Tax=Dinothrombium tinctorium TaxID=1965070 RepID=A0A443RL36_9ACAR|nr:BTB/POZ domain-containing protein KCTD12-like protein [Dinothrombium tinctorium]